MNGKDEQIVAFVFKRSGKDQLKESELYLILSMDLKWCSPKNAKEYITHLLSKGILKNNDDVIFPSFNVQEVVIPLDFHPRQEDFHFSNDDDVSGIIIKSAVEQGIKRIQKETSMDKTSIKNEIEVIIKEKQVQIEAALALCALYHLVDVSDLIPSLKEELITENTG